MTLTKEGFPLQYKKRPYYLWKRIEESFYKLGKKNGGQKSRHFGCIAGMRIQNSSKLMQKAGNWKTQFGESRIIQGRLLSSFEDMARLGSHHFKYLYSTDKE
jgi:hypothetical protein